MATPFQHAQLMAGCTVWQIPKSIIGTDSRIRLMAGYADPRSERSPRYGPAHARTSPVELRQISLINHGQFSSSATVPRPPSAQIYDRAAALRQHGEFLDGLA